jgi:hypothetical protein
MIVKMLTHMHMDSGIFVEMKCLFSIVTNDGTKGKVTEVIIAVF